MKTRLIPFIILSIVFSVGCKKLVEDRNEEPNNFTDADATLMASGMVLGDILVHEGELARTACIWSGQFTGGDRQYIALNTYTTTSGDYDNIWGTLYSETVKQARRIQDKADDLNNKPLKGFAQLIEAHAIGTATSLWGDVPFSEAADVETYPEPSYDGQAAVYAGLQTLLDDAIINLAGIGSIPGSVSGVTSAGSWIEVANSLKARYYLHTKDFAMAKSYAAIGISSGHDWMALHPADYSYGDGGRWNIYYSFLDWYRGGYMTADDAYLADILDPASANYVGDSLTDESGRFDAYYITPASAPWGYTYGGVYDPNYQSGVFDIAGSFPLFSYVENELILAEAELAGGDLDAALAHLNNVRAEHDANYGTGAGDVYKALARTDFQAGGMYYDGSGENTSMEKGILMEKYKSLYGQIEVWNDLRRTKNLIGVPIKAGSGATNIPQRLPYPQSEINSNDNVPANPDIYTPTPVNAN